MVTAEDAVALQADFQPLADRRAVLSNRMGAGTKYLGSRPPAAPLRIKGGIRGRLVVHFGSVPIDSGSALRAQVAVAGVEIECAYAVFAPRALEPYSALYSMGGVVGHALIVVLCSEERMHHGGLSKVTHSQMVPLDQLERRNGRDGQI
jgi:hypothetical protein